MASSSAATSSTSIVAGVKDYIQGMVEKVTGMKVMIVDEHTIGMISMVYSLSDILQYEIFRVEQIDMNHSDKTETHLSAICFLRPTPQNFILLSEMLKRPSYSEYHIFFSNAVPHERLERLACCDEFEVVHQVQEFYADVYAINRDLFSLNEDSTIGLTENKSSWGDFEYSVFERTVEGIVAACLCLQMLPAIRYNGSSLLAEQVAERLKVRMTEELSLFEQVARPKRGEASPVVLLLDRRNDPVTPLLNQWTYQAMLHELLTVKNNRIDMSNVQGVNPDMKNIVMSTTDDDFFQEHYLHPFPDLTEAIQKKMDDFQKNYNQRSQKTSAAATIEDMQKFVDEFPEFRRIQGNVAKHMQAISELKKIVDKNGLFTSSQLEQDLACTENQRVHFDEVMAELRGKSITNMQRLRLVLLYALRYEDRRTIKQLKDQLLAEGISQQQADIVDQLLKYSGSHVRSGDLFSNKSVGSKLKSAWDGLLKTDMFANRSVLSVLTQHKTNLGNVVGDLMKGRLEESMYPFKAADFTSNCRDPPPRAIVFMIGGASYEEARDVTMLNRSLGGGRCVVLGGTTIHNSRSFLAEVAQLGMDK